MFPWALRETPDSEKLQTFYFKRFPGEGFPDGSVIKNPPAKAGDTGWILIQEDHTCTKATKPARHNY